MGVIMVVGFYENRFLHTIPNTKNTFPTNFPKYKQIIENIFLFVKYFQLKMFYTRKTFYILPNVALKFGKTFYICSIPCTQYLSLP